MSPDLILRAKRLFNEFRVVNEVSVWWASYEGVLARRALSVWLGKLLKPQVAARADHQADQPVPVLRAWIAKNGRRLEGHPDYEALSQQEKEQTALLGRYTAEAVQLPVATVKTVLGEGPEEFEKRRIAKGWTVWVPVAQLASYPALLQWCKDNAHRIKGHPRYQEREGLEPLGIYRAETIALLQREYKRILSFVPENIKQRDLVLGGESKRHRLHVYVLTEEVSF